MLIVKLTVCDTGLGSEFKKKGREDKPALNCTSWDSTMQSLLQTRVYHYRNEVQLDCDGATAQASDQERRQMASSMRAYNHLTHDACSAATSGTVSVCPIFVLALRCYMLTH